MKKSLLLILISLLLAACSSSESSVPSVADLSTCETVGIVDPSTDANVEALRQAILTFRASLSDELLTEANNCLDSERFYLWHNTPANDENRDGITYGDLSDEQLAAFQNLLQAFLSEDGYQKMDDITFNAEGFLNEMMSNVWDTDFYSIDMFGDPENTGSWGFQLDGHHAAVNFLVHGDDVSMVPAFFGGEPVYGTFNGVEFDIFASERDLALELYNGLTEDELAAADSTDSGLSLMVGPADRNGDIDPYIGEYDYSGFETGLKYSDMSAETQAHVTALMQVYVYNLNTTFADVWWEKIMTNIDDTYFVWIDDVDAPTETSQFYYRFYNPAIWIEFNVEDVTGASADTIGEGNHAHAITRIPSGYNGGDYGIFANAINSGGPGTLLAHYEAIGGHHAMSSIEFDYQLADTSVEEDDHGHGHSHDG